MASPVLPSSIPITITGSSNETTVMDFKPPPFSKIRYRRPAHSVDADHAAKFNKAVELMKALPDDDPRSFKQQANLYRAYRSGDFDQVGLPDQDLQINSSWFFLPFHRLYLYFHERILSKLIGDPDFAMPFWSWDDPKGMSLPAIYGNPLSSPKLLVDLDYNGSAKDKTEEELIQSNLKVLYKKMVSGTKTASLFHGKADRAGAIEANFHNVINLWVEDHPPFEEYTGNFYSSGRDAMFYGLHANVDRMWDVWTKTLNRNNFNDEEWLNAAYYFYDENKDLVRVKTSDCLGTETLGYGYENVGTKLPWLVTKPVSSKSSKKGSGNLGHDHALTAKTGRHNGFPIFLDKVVRIEIPRPMKLRSKDEKEEEEEEILVLEGIQLQRDASVKFDVYINDEDDETQIGPEHSEFVGSFTNISHDHRRGNKLETSLSLAISDVLKDLDVEDEDNIVVTLVPRKGKGLVTIGNIKIDYVRE